MAEPELSVLTRQCLRQYLAQIERVAELAAQGARRATNGKPASIGNSERKMLGSS